MVPRIYWTVVFSLVAFGTIAQSLILTTKEQSLKGYVTHLRDEAGKLTFQQVQNMNFNSSPQDELLNFGFDRAAHWFKVDVTNRSAEQNWLLEIAFSPLDKIDFYIQQNPTTGWIHKTAGDLFPVSVRDVKIQNPVFEFTILPYQTRSIYLRVQTTSSVQLPATIWHRDAFFDKSIHVQMINGLFYGAMFLMVFYQFFLFLFVRERVTFYYVLTLLSMVSIVAFFQGYGFLYVYPDAPWINPILATLMGPVFILFSTLLTRAFLNLRENSRWLDNLLLANMSLDILAGILMLIFFRKISYEYHHHFIILHCVFALISAGYCWYRKYRPALYYLLSWVTLLFATVIFTMSNLGLFPEYTSTNYMGIMIGCILQMLLISLALGERWNMLMKENQSIKELELKRGQEENERLEREVQLRVEEIQLKTDRLEEVNRVKDKLFSIVSHDIKGPLSSLQLALSLMKTGTVSQEEFQQLTGALEMRFGQTTEFIENLLQWATLQLRGESFEPTCVDLSKLAHETIELLDFELRQKSLHIYNNLPAPLNVFADLNMIRSVLRNLLTNAIKFTGKEGSITLNAQYGDKYITVLVSDTGIGIPLENRSKLFSLSSVTTPGTKQEKGTGLGLLLCKEFIERNKGHIWFETTEGKGTTFYFSLPEFQEELIPIKTRQ